MKEIKTWPIVNNREGLVQLTKALIKDPLINAFVFSMVIPETGALMEKRNQKVDFTLKVGRIVFLVSIKCIITSIRVLSVVNQEGYPYSVHKSTLFYPFSVITYE